MKPTTWTVEYDSNNSGGDWWLKDDDWRKLEEAGWTVEWLGLAFCHAKYPNLGGKHPAPETCADEIVCPGHRGAESFTEAVTSGERWLGSIARSAVIDVTAYSSTLAEGIASEWWADAVGMNPDEIGCTCCGRPHSFYAKTEKAAVRA